MNTDGVFYSYQGLLADIYSGDSELSFEAFIEKVEESYRNGMLSGTQHDWLISNADI